MAKPYKQIRIKIPADLHSQIKSIAALTGKTLAQLIVDILRQGSASKP